jgi:hypothetical protein
LELLVIEHRRGRLVGREPDPDAQLGRHRLQTRCGVDGVTGQKRLARIRAYTEAHQGLTGIDSHAEPQRRALQRDQFLRALDDPEAGAHRSFGIVLVGDRHPEHSHHGVTDELLHHPTVPFDLSTSHRGVRSQHPVDVFGVGRFRGRSESDQIAEESRHDLPFLAGGHERPLGQGRGALRAELEAAFVLEPT